MEYNNQTHQGIFAGYGGNKRDFILILFFPITLLIWIPLENARFRLDLLGIFFNF